VLTLLDLIDHQARDVTPDIRRQLRSLGARGAEFAGWLYRDLRDLHRAALWYERATAWAQEAGDLPVQGYILLKKSQMAYDERDALRVVTLGQAAQEEMWQLPTKVRAPKSSSKVRGLAMTGASLNEVSRRLDQAPRAPLLALTTRPTRPPTSPPLQPSSTPSPDRQLLHGGRSSAPPPSSTETSSPPPAWPRATRAASWPGGPLARPGRTTRRRLRRRAATVTLAATTRSARTRRELGRAVGVLQPWRAPPRATRPQDA
jgi:hypothetical protein